MTISSTNIIRESIKIKNNWRNNYPLWKLAKVFTHYENHTSVQRIRILDSSELTAFTRNVYIRNFVEQNEKLFTVIKTQQNIKHCDSKILKPYHLVYLTERL